jgi:hypothetical protein
MGTAEFRPLVSRFLVVLGGLSLLGYAAGLVLFSGRFPAPGTAAEPRLVVLFVAATIFASILHVTSCLASYRRPPRLALILVVAFAARLGLLFGAPQPVLEGDPQRIRFEGRMVNRGIHPYEFPPAYIEDEASPDVLLTGSQHDRLLHARAAMTSSADAPRPREIRSPDVRSTSTPAALWIHALADRFKPQSTRGYAFFVLVADTLAVYLLLLALRAMGLPLSWVIAYAWSPVLLKEAYCTLAIDAFALPGIAGLVYCIARGWRYLAAIPLAAAAAVRLPLLLLVPVTARRVGLVGLVLAGLLLVLPYLPFHHPDVPPETCIEGSLHVWRHHEYNSSAESLLRSALGSVQAKAENSLTIAGVEIIRPQQRIDGILAKLSCALLLLGILTYLVIRLPGGEGRAGEVRRGHTDLFVAVAAMFFLGPVLEPAHALWLLPILVVRPSGIAWLLLPGLVSLSYLTHLAGPDAADLPLPLLDGRVSFRVVEYGSFVLLALLDLVWYPVLFQGLDRVVVQVPEAREAAPDEAEEPAEAEEIVF